MMNKTRYFLFGSAAVLVVGLCTGLMAYYGVASTGASAQVTMSDSEFGYIPADVPVVAFADVRQVMDSDLRRRIEESRSDDDQRPQRDFEESTGINFETDVDRIVAAMIPTAPTAPTAPTTPTTPNAAAAAADDDDDADDADGDADHDGDHDDNDDDDGDGFAIVTGRFNPTQLEAFAGEHGGAVEEYRGVRIVQGGQDEQMAIAFVEPGVLAVGGADAVRLAIDTRDAGQGLETNADMMRLVEGVEPGSNAWAVGRFDEFASQARLPETVANQIPPIQWFSVSGQVNDGLQGTLRAETRDEQAANNLREVVRGFLALFRMQTGAQPELGGVLEGLQVGGDGRTVAISFSLTGQAIDALMSRERREADE